MPDLLLYNTLTRKLETFQPIKGRDVGMYTCGPTVYQYAHIGNLRTYIFADTLRRVLQFNGYHIQHVMNITDVGHLTDDADSGHDKMEESAKREKKSALEIAEFYTQAFFQDLHTLNILEPHVRPKATEHIQEQIQLIEKLEKKGFTYKTSDGIYFDTKKFPAYGKLGLLSSQELQAGARVEANPEKRHPPDFALWKFSLAGQKRQMEWPSPWGVGFPGWHIECSAMSMKYLGESFDIHTGGIDHIPIHHTNEIAQSEAATGKPLARYWLHGEFLVLDETRMGKSQGNILTLATVQERGYNPLAYRYFVLNTHYRKPLSFSWEALNAAQNAYTSLLEKIQGWPEPKIGCAEFEARFHEAVNDDLNTPQALGILWELMRSDYPDHAKHQSINVFDRILGLGLSSLQPLSVPQTVKDLAANREQARQQKDFAQADHLRQQIEQAGFVVDDTPGGPIIKKRA